MTFRAAFILSLSIFVACAGSSASGQDVQWSFSADAMWLQRATAGPLAVALDAGGAPLEQAFAGNNFEPGVRFGLERTDAAGNSFELVYFGLQQWADDEFVLGDPFLNTATVFSPTLRFDDTIGGFNLGVIYSYRSRLHNAEFNRWWLCSESDQWKVHWLAGVRYFEFQEQLAMVGADINLGIELFDAAAYNALLGAQVGGKIERNFDRLSLFGIGKVGVYGNGWNSRVSNLVISAGPFPQPFINRLDDGTNVAGLLEVGGGVCYRLTNWLTFRADYNVFYVPGLVLQPSPGGLGGQPTDGLVLHGASTGLEFVW